MPEVQISRLDTNPQVSGRSALLQVFRNRQFTSVALGHLTIDIFNGQRFVLLTHFAILMGLSNTTLGLASTIYILVGSLPQMVWGYLADRWGPRWLVPAGILWMGLFLALAVITPGMGAIYFLILASLGSGMFHPAGAMQATLIGQTHLAGREATAASLFFLFGQLGYFFGPVIGGKVLDSLGLPWFILIAVFGLPVAAFAFINLRHHRQHLEADRQRDGGSKLKINMSRFGFIALIIASAAQAMTQGNMNTFLPRYLADLGHPAFLYGTLAALFMGGAAVGNLVGGQVADRFTKRAAVATGMLAASLPIFVIGLLQNLTPLILIIPVAGVFTGMSYAVMVVMGQKALPGGMGIASGLVLTFTFSAGAIGPVVSGAAADVWGLPAVFTLTGLVSLLGGLVALGFRKEDA